MNAVPQQFPLSPRSELAWLQRFAVLGAVLAVAILGASMLLRLTTAFAVDGQTFSRLPPAIEQATRLVHRLAASGVGLLALFALVQSWRHRRSRAQPAKPTAWIVGTTLVLAVIGPLTPGYTLGAITVINVGFGMILLMAFWWLRESVRAACESVPNVQGLDQFSWAALLAFVGHVGTGAAASAWQMHGVGWPAWVHVGSLVVCVAFLGVLVVSNRRKRTHSRYTTAIEALLLLQLIGGYVLMWQDQRAVWLSFLHGMLSPALAMAFVSLLLRSGTPSRIQ